MTGSGYFNNGNFREYSYFAGGGDFAVLKPKFPEALTAELDCNEIFLREAFCGLEYAENAFAAGLCRRPH